MRKRVLGYLESPDGSERVAHIEGQKIPPGWKVRNGEKIPGPPINPITPYSIRLDRIEEELNLGV